MAVANPKMPSPTINARLRPNLSLRLPAASTSAAKVRL